MFMIFMYKMIGYLNENVRAIKIKSDIRVNLKCPETDKFCTPHLRSDRTFFSYVNCMSDIDGDATSKILRPANFHTVEELNRTSCSDAEGS